MMVMGCPMMQRRQQTQHEMSQVIIQPQGRTHHVMPAMDVDSVDCDVAIDIVMIS
jgi:hypothetical protein